MKDVYGMPLKKGDQNARYPQVGYVNTGTIFFLKPIYCAAFLGAVAEQESSYTKEITIEQE